MQKFIPVIFLLALVITGCDVQRGRFVTTTVTGNALSSPVGAIDIVDGYEKQPAQKTDILNDHLLFMLFITPGVQEHGSASSSDLGKYVTTLNHSWNTDKGMFTVSIPWNRQTDTVTIGRQDFIRERGDVFVVRLNAKGEISGQQLPSLGGAVRSQEVLKYVQQQLSADKIIASVKLYK